MHLEGGFTVPVAETVAVISDAYHATTAGSIWLITSGLDGPCVIPTSRILWVSTVPEVAS